HHLSTLDRVLVNRRIPQDYQRHCIENNLAFLPLANAQPRLPNHDYEIYLSPAELEWAETYVKEQRLSERQLLGIHVGSGGTKNLALRRWPLELYLELLKRLNQTRSELTVLLFGGPEEEQDHQRLLAR